jgi:hypothetical protein
MTTQENTPTVEACTVARSSLLPVLVRAAKMAIRDQDRPAFAHVRIAAGGGFLTVTASDGGLVLTTTLAAPGDLAPRLVNLRALTDAVRAVCITDRLCLHAFRLEIVLPDGKPLLLESPMPADMLEIWTSL